MAGVPANKSVKSDLIAGVPANKSVKSDLIAGVPANKSVKSDLIAEPPASLSAFAAASAQVAPLSKHLPWHRRGLRRSLGIYRGVGAGCAALSAFTGVTGERCADRWVAERDCLRRTHVKISLPAVLSFRQNRKKRQ